MAFPGGAQGPFDLSALQQALNVSVGISCGCVSAAVAANSKPVCFPQDPSIKEMAEQIAGDPSFQGLTSQLQESMAGMMAGGGAGPAAPDPRNFDPAQYMQAMSNMFQNQNFMQMAEKLGQAIIQVI